MNFDLDFTKRVVERKVYLDWKSFVSEIEQRSNLENSIFRGQSNFDVKLNDSPTANNDEFKEWQINSTFCRQNRITSFKMKVLKHLKTDKWEEIISKFEHIKDKMVLEKINLLERIQYFQHYKIATPLIDFTKDFNIALYFATNEIQFGDSRSLNGEYPNCFFNIIEVNTKMLTDIYCLKKLELTDINSLDLNNFENNGTTFFLHLNPPNTLNANFNLKIQKSVFIYLESSFSLEEYIGMQNISEDKPKPITYHLIPYNSISSIGLNSNSKNQSDQLINYLRAKKCLGYNLFNDLQGLKYDLNFLNSLN